MQEVAEELLGEVEPMQAVAEELAAKLAVQSAAKLVVKLAVVVLTGTKTWALSAAAAIMHQRLIDMLAAARANMVFKKVAFPDLAIGVASSSFPSASSCRFC